MAKSNAVIGERSRRIAHRTYGRRHGPITRLMSPSDLGEILKPFVFLDLFNTEGGSFSGFGLHPHSGIATLQFEDRERGDAHHLKARQDDETDALHEAPRKMS